MMLEDPTMSAHLFLPNKPKFDGPPAAAAPAAIDWSTRVVNNIWESRGWHEHVTCGIGLTGSAPTDFGNGQENDYRNIVLSLSSDGFVPHKNSQRSITPITAMILNLPENLRHRACNLLLIGLIPGPNAPKSMNPFLDIVVNELIHLYNVGFSIRDPTALYADVKVRVKLLFTCADYPAHNKMNLQQGANAYYGCIKCHIQVSSHLNLIFADSDQTV